MLMPLVMKFLSKIGFYFYSDVMDLVIFLSFERVFLSDPLLDFILPEIMITSYVCLY